MGSVFHMPNRFDFYWCKSSESMPRVHFAAIFLSLSRGFISTFNNILLSCAVPNFQSLLIEKIESQSPSWFRAGRELLHLADSLILTSLKHRLTRFIIITWARPTSAHRAPCHLDSPCCMVQSCGQSVLPCADSPLNLELDSTPPGPPSLVARGHLPIRSERAEEWGTSTLSARTWGRCKNCTRGKGTDRDQSYRWGHTEGCSL
jgi:hypothetical protein